MREKSTKSVKKTKNRGIYMQILRNQRRDRVSKLEKRTKSGLLTNKSAGNIMATTSETKTIKNNRTGKKTRRMQRCILGYAFVFLPVCRTFWRRKMRKMRKRGTGYGEKEYLFQLR